MSAIKITTDSITSDKKLEIEPLDPVIEVNENVPSEVFDDDRFCEEAQFNEIAPKIFGLKDILEPLTIEALNNATYELGVINLCWPEIENPVFETRMCFPQSYYVNTNKERLLLAYAENFRRQFLFYFKLRKPLFLQAPNDCGLQKMVCTSLRPTKLCFADTITWQNLASLVADFFDYEPLRKPMLQVLGVYQQNPCITYILKDIGLSRTTTSSFMDSISKAALAGLYQIWLDREGSRSVSVDISSRRPINLHLALLMLLLFCNTMDLAPLLNPWNAK